MKEKTVQEYVALFIKEAAINFDCATYRLLADLMEEGKKRLPRKGIDITEMSVKVILKDLNEKYKDVAHELQDHYSRPVLKKDGFVQFILAHLEVDIGTKYQGN